MIRSNKSYEYITVIPGNKDHEYYLSVMENHPLCPEQNKTKKAYKYDLLSTNGIMTLILADGEFFGFDAGLVIEENGIKYMKQPYRTFFTKSVGNEPECSYKFLDYAIENNINYFVTYINVNKPRNLRAWQYETNKRIKHNCWLKRYPSKYHHIVNNYTTVDFMVYEQYTWSVPFFSSPNKEWFLDRPQRQIEYFYDKSPY
jgi:hypothetical protein